MMKRDQMESTVGLVRKVLFSLRAWMVLAPASLPRRTVKALLLRARGELGRFPRIKAGIGRVLAFCPPLEHRLRCMRNCPAPAPVTGLLTVADLPQRARELHAHLLDAVRDSRKERG